MDKSVFVVNLSCGMESSLQNIRSKCTVYHTLHVPEICFVEETNMHLCQSQRFIYKYYQIKMKFSNFFSFSIPITKNKQINNNICLLINATNADPICFGVFFSSVLPHATTFHADDKIKPTPI